MGFDDLMALMFIVYKSLTTQAGWLFRYSHMSPENASALLRYVARCGIDSGVGDGSRHKATRTRSAMLKLHD